MGSKGCFFFVFFLKKSLKLGRIGSSSNITLRVILLFESCLWQDLASMIMRSKYGGQAKAEGGGVLKKKIKQGPDRLSVKACAYTIVFRSGAANTLCWCGLGPV